MRNATARWMVLVCITGACSSVGQAPPQPTAPAASAGAEPAVAPTGAVTSLTDAKAAGAAEPLSIEEYLRGRVPGLQVITTGAGFTLRLRGPNLSLVGGREIEPLVVIDGMPVAPAHLSQVLGTLNPRDIRRVDVLRDVASTSVYGTRAASGVILIRTTGG